MQEEKIINRRRNYFIDKNFQTKFIIRFCLLIMLASLMTGALIYYFNMQTTTVAFENLKVVVKSTADFILPIMFQVIIIVTVIVGLATIAVTLFTSHKIAGPLYKLKMELGKMKEGDFSSPIRIRAKDQLQKVVSEFDGMRSDINKSMGTLKEAWSSIKAELSLLEREVKDEAKRKLLADSIKRLDSELARFKTN